MKQKLAMSLRCFGLPVEATVCLIYVIVATAWIYFSDQVLAFFVQDADRLVEWSTYKGWFYVAMTAALLFGMLKRIFIRIRLAQGKLLESEERFRFIFEQAGDGILLLNDELVIVDCNDSVCKIYGVENKGEVIGKTPLDFSPERQADGQLSVEKAKELVAELQGGQSVRFYWQHIQPMGAMVDAEVSLNRLVIGDHAIMQAIIRNATGHTRAIDGLRHEADLSKYLLELHEKAQELTDKELYNYVLEHVVSITKSQIGFIHVVSEDQKTVALVTWNSEELNACLLVSESHCSLEEAGSWVDVVHLKEPVVYNDYPNSPNPKGLIEGHAPLLRFMSVPVLEKDKVRIIFGVGNKSEEYNIYDVIQTQVVANELQKVLKQRRAEQQLQYIIDNTTDVIFQIDLEGNYIYVNSAAEKLTGYSTDQLLAMNMMDVVAPEYHAERTGRLQRRIDGQARDGVYTLEILRKDGRRRWMELSNTSVLNDAGELVAVQGVARDITERKQMMLSLQQSERTFRDLFEKSANAQLIIRDGKFVDFNQATLDMLGYRTRDEFMVVHPSTLSPEKQPDGRSSFEKAEEMMELAFKNGSHQFEWQHKRANGEEFPVHVLLTAISDSDGNTIIHVVWVDISERKKKEAELQRLSTAIDQAAEAVVITDTEGVIEYVNPAFEAITGYCKEEAVGATSRILKSDVHDEAFYNDLWKRISSGKTWMGHLWNKRKDGSLYTEETTISPVHNDSGIIVNYVAVKRDITKELNLEAQFRQSQKMEAVGRLAGGVAHDFNNILQTIVGFCGLLLEETEEQKSLQQDVLEIQNAAERAGNLTRQLLAFSRKKPIDFSPVDLNAIIANEERMLGLLLDKSMRLVFEPAADLRPLIADSSQLEQVVMNLVVNARDAMPDGGEITIRTENVVLSNPSALMPKSRLGTFVCLSVSDTGIGIGKEVLEHLFEPFFTTKSIGNKGTGLGLAIIYGVIEQHKGWINVESEEGMGSIFRVYLPAADGPRVQADMSRNEDPSPSGECAAGEHILLVEDDSEVRNITTHLLQDAGYRVTAVESAQQATEAFEQEGGGSFDLLFSDVILPDQTGVELAAFLRETVAGLPVVLFSGHSDEQVQLEVIKKHGYHYIKKPFQITSLLSTISSSLK